MPHPFQPHPHLLLIIGPIAIPEPKEIIGVAARPIGEYHPGTTTGAP
jgi:hypothetical protein